jgi:VWFA-related protein
MTSRFTEISARCSRLSRFFLPLFLATTTFTPKLLFGLSPDDSEEPSNGTYHSTVSEVRLVFFATDEHNHAVEELQQTDFAVVDDERVIRDFRSFSRSSEIKLDVVVLIDSSESVLPQFRHEIADVLQLISKWPWNPEDNLSVLTFGGLETHVLCTGNCRNSFTADRVASLPNGGATPLFDAIETAADLLIPHRQPDVWPVIILFSDGDDTISKASFRQASDKILASGAQVYAIDLSNPARPSLGTATLRRLADDSGGRSARISDGAAGVFRNVIDDLHSARVVTYALPKSGSEFHSVRILPTHNLNLQFRCRRGYYHHSGSARLEDGP